MTRIRNVGGRAASAGFTLLSVLVAMLIMGFGLLGMVRATLAVTTATSQNETLSSMAALSNGFWGVVQANPNLLATSSFANTYTSSNYASAPTMPLQTWLGLVTSTLPGAQVTIATGPDSASNAACAVATGCTVVLTLQWTQVGAPGVAAATRTQTFYYQFGL